MNQLAIKKLVLALPIFQLKKGTYSPISEIIDEIKKNYYLIYDKNFIWSRPRQYIARQILILERK